MKSLAASLALVALVASSGTVRAADEILVTVPDTIDWTGFYAGGHIGYGWGHGRYVDPPDVTNFYPDGLIGGVQAGYNYQWGNYVFGVEGDFTLADMHFGPVSGPNRELFVNWLASIRGRAGVAMGAIGPAQSVYLYGTGGIAFTEFGVASSPGAAGRRSDTFTRVGWTIGAGVEALVTDKVSVKTEFLHMDFGASNLNVPRFDATPTRLSVNSIRLGVNVHF